jgi:SAM-dependent methyltransferase
MSVEVDWDPAVLRLYERALWDRAALRACDGAGADLDFDVRRWLRPADRADLTMLARCTGPTLDIGCGPGRLVAALARRGVPALGVDVAAAAIALTRSAGGLALRRSVFDRVPGAGRWQAALLADGNVGIGGDVGGLLARIRELLAPGAVVVVEVEADGISRRTRVQVTDAAGRETAAFAWARVGWSALIAEAVATGFVAVEQWSCDGRHFASLRRI